MGVIVKPLITEKSNMLSEKLGQYVFIVDLGASKPEIIKACDPFAGGMDKMSKLKNKYC